MSDSRRTRSDGEAQLSADVVVVGAGVIGLATAWRIASQGGEVMVVDRAEIGTGASHVAAGMLAPAGEAEWGEADLVAFCTEAARRYPAFCEALSDDCGFAVPYRRCGALHIALDRDEHDQLARIATLHDQLGLGSERLLGSEARRLEPALATSVRSGLLAPAEAEVDPRALLDSLAAACRRRGVIFEVEAEVVAAETRAGRIEALSTASGMRLHADHYVLAGGAWSSAGWLPEHARPPVRPVKGELVRMRERGAGLPIERIVVSEHMYAVPRSSGELVVGATSEERGFDLTVTAGGVHELLREAYRAIPEIAELEFGEATAGLRPGTPDNLPLIGRGTLDGLIVASGHYRNGILLAGVTAEAVCELAGGPAAGLELEPFSPQRFTGAGQLR